MGQAGIRLESRHGERKAQLAPARLLQDRVKDQCGVASENTHVALDPLHRVGQAVGTPAGALGDEPDSFLGGFTAKRKGKPVFGPLLVCQQGTLFM